MSVSIPEYCHSTPHGSCLYLHIETANAPAAIGPYGKEYDKVNEYIEQVVDIFANSSSHQGERHGLHLWPNPSYPFNWYMTCYRPTYKD